MNNFFGLLKIAMRRTGALALAAVLALLLAAPAVRADTRYLMNSELSGTCIPFLTDAFAVTIPALDFFGQLDGAPRLQENRFGGTANYSGGVWEDPGRGIRLDVKLRMSGKGSCVVPEIIDPQTCETPDTYQCFSSWSGTLEVVQHNINPAAVGAVFSLTGTDKFIVGDGASIWSEKLGGRGDFSIELDDPASFPGLPAGPLSGNFRFLAHIALAVQAVADASVIGTWEGTLDCIGQTGQTDNLATSDTSSDVTLLISRHGAELIKGVGLDAEPSGDTFCVNLPVSADGFTGDGLLASPETFDPQGFVKVDGDTLKLRLLRGEGRIMDNVDFCKAEFTLTDPADPEVVVAGSCDTTGSLLDAAARQEFCDTVVCGPGTICEKKQSVAGTDIPLLCVFPFN